MLNAIASIRALFVPVLISLLVGMAAGAYVHAKLGQAEQVSIAKKEVKETRADAIAAVSKAQQADKALSDRHDDIQAQTKAAISKVKSYATRPVQPVRSTQSQHAPATAPDNQPAQQPSVCWDDLHLSTGTVGVLNAARAGVPLDRAALPSDEEGKAPSAITAGDLIESDIEVSGQYRALAADHDALVDYVEGLQRKQREAAGVEN